MGKVTMGTFECSKEDIDTVSNALKSGYLSSGPEMDKFENQVSNICSKKYGVMVNSGQSALEVALILAKKKLKKSELKVLIPATTYAATLWAIINTNCIPIFCDIGEDYNIGTHLYNVLEENEVDVIMSVDLCGKNAYIPRPILKDYFVIEDACEAFGNPNCYYGDIVCYSFYVSHIITTGSGGMVCLNDSELTEYARSYISHGRVFGGDFTKHKDKWVDRFLFDKVGTSYRSDNLSASLGLSQLKKLNFIIKKRKQNAKKLITLYNKSEKLQEYFYFPSIGYWKNCVFQFFPIVIKKDIDREEFLTYLFDRKISSRVLLSLTNQPIVKKLYGEDLENKYKNSQFCNDNGFIIGCHQNLSENDMEYVIDTFIDYLPKKRDK